LERPPHPQHKYGSRKAHGSAAKAASSFAIKHSIQATGLVCTVLLFDDARMVCQGSSRRVIISKETIDRQGQPKTWLIVDAGSNLLIPIDHRS
jgi:hypothetical protein